MLHNIQQIEKYDEGGLERIINIVLEQAEFVNHLVGIRYWLLTSIIKTVNENQIYDIWKRSSITTSFCIFCNDLRNFLMNEYFSKGIRLISDDYIKISKELAEQILEQEKTAIESDVFLPVLKEIFYLNFPFPVLRINGLYNNLPT